MSRDTFELYKRVNLLKTRDILLTGSIVRIQLCVEVRFVLVVEEVH